MKYLFDLLEKKKKRRTPFVRSEEYLFFVENRSVLSKIPRFSFLDDLREDEFDVMRANIVINSYLNKRAIEEEMENFESYNKIGEGIDHIKILQTLRDKMVDKPYVKDDKEKIYIPFFSRTLNSLYNHEPEKLLTSPYDALKDEFADSVIDLFDTFGFDLYNSNFTRLLKIGEHYNIAAYFHYDTNTIYIINNQGRMDAKIVLFDKYMRHPAYSHMLDRIKSVVEAYFNNDRNALINALHDQQLISSRLLYQIHKKGYRK